MLTRPLQRISTTTSVRCVSRQASPNVDYYDVLNLKPGASPKEIKTAFYALSKQFHPDIAQTDDKDEAAKKFHEIAQAYDVLSSAESRKVYDMTRIRRAPDIRTGYARPVTNTMRRQYTDVDIDYKDFEHFQRSTRRRRASHSHFEMPEEFFQGLGGKTREFKSEWDETQAKFDGMYKDSRAAQREEAEMQAEYEREKARQQAKYPIPTFAQMMEEKRRKEREEQQKYVAGLLSISTLGLLLFVLMR